MLGNFGASQFGSTQFAIPELPGLGGKIALLGDPSSHGGVIITTNQDGTFKTAGIAVAVDGALHSCPIAGHGVTPIRAVTTKSFHNGKLIVTENAIAGCGALIQPADRKVEVE
jgi:uncharacterized Zn-binding protein involved in type VI secretion